MESSLKGLRNRALLTTAASVAISATLLTGAFAQPQRGGGPRQGIRQGGGGGGQGQGQGQGQGGGMRRSDGDGGGAGGGGGPTSRPSPDQMFDRADTNHDGSLSRDEFRTFLRAFMEHHRPGGPGTRPSGDNT